MASAEIANRGNEIFAAFEVAKKSFAESYPDVRLTEPELDNFDFNDYVASIYWSRVENPETNLVLYFDYGLMEISLSEYIWIEAYIEKARDFWKKVGREEVSITNSLVSDQNLLQEAIKKLYILMNTMELPAVLETVSLDDDDELPEKEYLARSIGNELTEIFVKYVDGEIEFDDLIFASYDAHEDLHVIRSDNSLLEYDDNEPQTPNESRIREFGQKGGQSSADH
jgi:hypothetical protein